MSNISEAKLILDRLISKQKNYAYKPIQIAEILYKDRVERLNLLDLESYRTSSKKWRDEISLKLYGRICTSSARYQDNLFDDNAMPPRVLAVLAAYNRKKQGAVEKYIYNNIFDKLSSLMKVSSYISQANSDGFKFNGLLNFFRNDKKLKSSLDKACEISVYALIKSILSVTQPVISISINNSSIISNFPSHIM